MNKKIVTAFCLLLLFFIVHLANAQTYILSTAAGSGNVGANIGGDTGDGGPAQEATLNLPWGVAVDKYGNVYFADYNNSEIRKIDTNGILTSVAAYGNAGLSSVTGVAVDTFGNVFICDWYHDRIQKVDKNGVVTTFAGKEAYGFSGDGGKADSAEMTEPYGVATDDSGNVYIADAFNNRIRKVNTQGIITTVAGNGNAGYGGDGGLAINASLHTPVDMKADKFGNLYIDDLGNRVIRKVDKNGIISTVAGNGGSGYNGDNIPATSAQLNVAFGIGVDDSGLLYIADGANNRVRKVDKNGIITTIVGNGTAGYSGDGGSPSLAELNSPFGVAIDHAGNIYIADQNNNRIRRLSPCSSRFKFSPATPHICQGLSKTIYLDALNEYTWLPASGLNTTTGPTVVANPTITTTYTITGQTCTGNGTFVVTIDTFPVIKTTPPTHVICEGQTIQLNATGGNTYKWSPARGLNQVAGSSVTATGGFNTTYTIVGSNGYCASTDSIVLTVGNSFKPGNVTASKDSVCTGTPIKLTVAGSGGTILWQSSGSQSGFKNISGATDTVYSLSASTTSYYRTIANNGVCGDTSIAYLLTVIPSPVTTFTSFTIGQQVTFTPATSGGVVNYSWNFGDNTTSTDSFPVHTYTENASYNVCLTVYNKSDCSYTTCNNVDIGVSGVQNVAQQTDWNIFPNPATGSITLVTNSSGSEKTSIEITNVLGEVVYAKTIVGNKTQVNLNQLSPGTYFVHLQSGDISDVKKLIKN